MDRKEYQRNYQRAWIARRRASYFVDKCCIQCGATDNLELDHIDPALKVAHQIWSWSAERQQAELAKCQVLCHECHLAKSRKIDWPAMRGYDPDAHNNTRYRRRKCRCDLCKADHTKVNRESRQRNAGLTDQPGATLQK